MASALIRQIDVDALAKLRDGKPFVRRASLDLLVRGGYVRALRDEPVVSDDYEILDEGHKLLAAWST